MARKGMIQESYFMKYFTPLTGFEVVCYYVKGCLLSKLYEVFVSGRTRKSIPDDHKCLV